MINFVYAPSAIKVVIIPIADMPIQVITVTFHPRVEVAAMPYIEIAAPMYTQALQKPLAVADLPIAEKRPGRHEISKKFIACINAQTSAARTRHTMRITGESEPIRIDKGIQDTAAATNITSEPRTSLPNRGDL